MWIERRGLMIGVGASLLLNVFLVGVVAGHAFGWRHGGPAVRPIGGALVPPRHIRSLPPDERKLFNAGMESHREAIRAAHQEWLRFRLQTEADIGAATFDRDKVAADFKALREANSANQEQLQNGLLDALQAISQSSREALVSHAEPGAKRDTAAH